MQKFSVSLFAFRKTFADSFFTFHFAYYNRKIDTVAKRGSMLENMVVNRDKVKNWHVNILAQKPKCRRHVFEGVHRPTKRQRVLNSVLIKNITDVISTGDVAPEILGHGIEITGVKVSPCCKILNVFWQIPPSRTDHCEELDELLAFAGPKIRAELISRNVLGRVPHIFFLRDCTNARIAAFETAIKEVEKEIGTESSVIPDESFLDDIYSFKTSKDMKKKNEETAPTTDTMNIKSRVLGKPPDMKSDIFGLNHETMMKQVIALKRKPKQTVQQSAVIDPLTMTNDDLFSKIPGVCFQSDSTQDDILKKFHTERKLAKRRSIELKNDNSNFVETEDYNPHKNLYVDENDFIEDDD